MANALLQNPAGWFIIIHILQQQNGTGSWVALVQTGNNDEKGALKDRRKCCTLATGFSTSTVLIMIGKMFGSGPELQ